MGKNSVDSVRDMLRLLGSKHAEGGPQVPATCGNTATFGNRCANDNRLLVALRRKRGRRALDEAFKGEFIDGLNEEHVAKWVAELNNRTGAANRTLEILKHMLNKAEAWGYRLENTNPCRGIRPNRRKKCERFLTREELVRLGHELALLQASDDPTMRCTGAALTLLLLTGCRYKEILTLQWDDVKGSRLHLRDSKTGPRTVWLGTVAREVFASLPRQARNPWLFWNYQYRRPMRCIRHTWLQIIDRAELGKLRIHDLRHTFASHAAMNKEILPMIGRLLGHANHRSTARYAHLWNCVPRPCCYASENSSQVHSV